MGIAILIGLVILVVVLKFVPIRRTMLIEGVFVHKSRDVDFHDNWFHSYEFDYACRDCWEKNEPSDFFDKCGASVPERSLRLSSIEPQKGDSIKIIGYKNIFGWVRAYKIVRTNFAEELAEKQHAKEEQEWQEYHEASDRRSALERGLSVEDYRHVTKEEDIRDTAEALKITEEEVVANKYDELPMCSQATARELIATTGKMPSLEEIYKEDAKIREDFMKRLEKSLPLSTQDYHCHMTTKFRLCRYHWEFATTGTLADKYALSHTEQCDECRAVLEETRTSYQKTAGSSCLDEKDLASIRKTGHINPITKSHVARCDRCHVHSEICKERHLNDPPGTECLTKDDLHQIHTSGQTPTNKISHLTECERCKQQYERHKNTYLDRVAPRPNLPTMRLRSLKEHKKALV